MISTCKEICLQTKQPMNSINNVIFEHSARNMCALTSHSNKLVPFRLRPILPKEIGLNDRSLHIYQQIHGYMQVKRMTWRIKSTCSFTFMVSFLGTFPFPHFSQTFLLKPFTALKKYAKITIQIGLDCPLDIFTLILREWYIFIKNLRLKQTISFN